MGDGSVIVRWKRVFAVVNEEGHCDVSVAFASSSATLVPGMPFTTCDPDKCDGAFPVVQSLAHIQSALAPLGIILTRDGILESVAMCSAGQLANR